MAAKYAFNSVPGPNGLTILARCNAAGHAFISADYRLIPSGLSNAHGILEDVKDVFSFICSSEFELALAKTRDEEGTIRIDPKRIAVAGTSSGGTCAYLAAKHAEPKPRALLSIYAAGGDFFVRIFRFHVQKIQDN